MNGQEFQDALTTLLNEIAYMDADDLDRFEVPAGLEEVDRVRTFGEAGVMTSEAGMVVRMRDGAEYQVTIIQSR